MRTYMIVGLGLLIGLGAACQGTQPAGPDGQVKEEVNQQGAPKAMSSTSQPAMSNADVRIEEMGALGGEVSKSHLHLPRVSDDGRHVALVVQTAGGFRMIHDGKAGEEYDEIALHQLSDDGSRLAYAARKGDKWFAVVDGKAEGPYDSVPEGNWGLLRFSPDGKHIWYAAKTGDAEYIVLDGKRYPRRGKTLVWTTPDGDVHWVLDGTADEKTQVFVNGKVADQHEAISWWEPYQPDRERPRAYRIKRGQEWYPVVLGQVQAASGTVGQPVYSPNGKHFAYIGVEGDKQFVVVDGRRDGMHEEVLEQSLQIDDTGQATYVAGAKSYGGKKSLIVGGKTVQDFYFVRLHPGEREGERVPRGIFVVNLDPPVRGDPDPDSQRVQVIRQRKADEAYNQIGTPVASQDGKHWAYAAKRDRKWHLVVDGKATVKDVDELAVVGFLTDGRLVYCVMKDSVSTVFIGEDGTPGYTRDIRLTNDGRNVIWVNSMPSLDGNEMQEVLVVNGRPGPRFHKVMADWRDTKVSPSGKYAYYLVNRRARGTAWMLVSGDRIVTDKGYGVAFSSTGDRVAYVERAGNRRRVCVDEQLIGEYDDLPGLPGGLAAFSSDGKHLAFIVRNGEKHAMVVDGVQGPLCDQIVVTHFAPRWGADGMTYFAVRDGELLRVTQSATQPAGSAPALLEIRALPGSDVDMSRASKEAAMD